MILEFITDWFNYIIIDYYNRDFTFPSRSIITRFYIQIYLDQPKDKFLAIIRDNVS